VNSYRLLVRSCAERDIAAAIAGYDGIAKGLGAMFLMRTDAAIATSAKGSGRESLNTAS